jgi:SAM-dependent methyltransferase
MSNAGSIGTDPLELMDIISRSQPPLPWAEGDNIPWNEPGFSRRMLNEHLSQAHDAASRRFSTIDRQVEWIHTHLFAQLPTSILDLACGPGFYTARLAARGHTCHGIDYSPASIEYATSTARAKGLACTYLCQDIRQAEFPQGVELAMLIYGEFNVFRPQDAKIIIDKVWQSLKPGGLLLLEPHPYQLVHKMGQQPPSWYSSSGGLFSEEPHLLLQENYWDVEQRVTTTRYYVIDSHSTVVIRYAQSIKAYHDEEYRSLLSTHGFANIRILPGLIGDDSPTDLIAITARKKV